MVLEVVVALRGGLLCAHSEVSYMEVDIHGYNTC